jgi:hypothetical protein
MGRRQGGVGALCGQNFAAQHEQIAMGAVIGTRLRTGMRRCAAYISPKEIAMFKAAVVVFALTVSGFMLWVAHEDANFAQLPHATLIKRAA